MTTDEFVTYPPNLVVIGAGPKAIAVAAKATVLDELGLPSPKVTIIEEQAIGANWTPAGGWTDGSQRLGTSPEKDLGFPYRSSAFKGLNHHIDSAMSRFSWSSYLIAAGRYGSWIDRGRPAPKHQEWAWYLQWAIEQTNAEVLYAQAHHISIADERWLIRCVGLAEKTGVSVTGDALMITGPGTASSEWELHNDHVAGPATFWNQVHNHTVPVVDRVAVIGAGETAGAILQQMCRHDASTISVIAPRASLYTRGEGVFENSTFTDTARWETLSIAQRRELINRADHGVLSIRAMEELRLDTRVSHVEGRAVALQSVTDHVVVDIDTAAGHDTWTFDYVIDARGAQHLWMLNLFDTSVKERLEQAVGGSLTADRIQLSIERFLSTGTMQPPLILPTLAGLRQGPGIPNLSCLGELSDRVCAGLVK